MAYLLHSQLLLLTTLILVLNLSYYSVVGKRLVGGIEESSMEEDGAQEALDFAVSQYNEKSSDLFLRRMVEVISVKIQVCDPL